MRETMNRSVLHSFHPRISYDADLKLMRVTLTPMTPPRYFSDESDALDYIKRKAGEAAARAYESAARAP